MRYDHSARLHDDVSSAVQDDVSSAVQMAFKTTGVVNISAVAEQVRVRNLAENVALEDIERLVLQAAQLIGAAMEFDGLSDGLALLAVGHDDGEYENALPDLPRSVSIQ